MGALLVNGQYKRLGNLLLGVPRLLHGLLLPQTGSNAGKLTLKLAEKSGGTSMARKLRVGDDYWRPDPPSGRLLAIRADRLRRLGRIDERIKGGQRHFKISRGCLIWS